MKLQISWKKRRIANGLFRGGVAAMILAILVCAVSPQTGAVVMCAGFAAGLGGAIWVGRLYRCPRCGRQLLGRGWEALTLTTYNHCPNCGWTVDITYTD